MLPCTLSPRLTKSLSMCLIASQCSHDRGRAPPGHRPSHQPGEMQRPQLPLPGCPGSPKTRLACLEPRAGGSGWGLGPGSGHQHRALAWCPPPTVSAATTPKVTSLTCHRPVLPKPIPHAPVPRLPAESQLSAAGEEHSIRQNNTQGGNDFPFTPHYA